MEIMDFKKKRQINSCRRGGTRPGTGPKQKALVDKIQDGTAKGILVMPYDLPEPEDIQGEDVRRTLKPLMLLFTSGRRKMVSSKEATNTRIAAPFLARSSAASAAVLLSAGYTAAPDTNTLRGAAIPTARIRINATCFL